MVKVKSRPQRTSSRHTRKPRVLATYRGGDYYWVACSSGGGLRNWGDEISVKMGKMGKHFCPHFLQRLPENVDRRSCNGGGRGLFQYFTTLTENADPLLGGGSHLGVPCGGALLIRFEQEEGKISSDQYPNGSWVS